MHIWFSVFVSSRSSGIRSLLQYIVYNTDVKDPCGLLTQAWGTVFWRCWLTLNILFSILVETLNMSRLLSTIEENTATLHFCLGSGSPWGRERTAFSTRRISRAIPTCIICNAQLPFTTHYCSTTEAWQCQGLWWLGRYRPQKFVFVSWAPKSYLTTWGPGSMIH